MKEISTTKSQSKSFALLIAICLANCLFSFAFLLAGCEGLRLAPSEQQKQNA
jgi:hypothetical protein